MEKMIKHRLFTWFEETHDPTQPEDSGNTVLTERIARLGEVVDITNPTYIRRGEELDAFFTDDERKAIENGTYTGPAAEQVYWHRNAMAGQSAPPPSAVQAVEGEGALDLASADAAQVAEYIEQNNLNVADTVALAGDDVESIEKVIDAENLATGNDPRKGVIDRLEAKLNAATA